MVLTYFSPNSFAIDPPVFWTEVYAEANKRWVTVDPVRGIVNTPLKMHPANSCTTNHLAYVVAYDEGKQMLFSDTFDADYV